MVWCHGVLLLPPNSMPLRRTYPASEHCLLFRRQPCFIHGTVLGMDNQVTSTSQPWNCTAKNILSHLPEKDTFSEGGCERPGWGPQDLEVYPYSISEELTESSPEWPRWFICPRHFLRGPVCPHHHRCLVSFFLLLDWRIINIHCSLGFKCAI